VCGSNVEIIAISAICELPVSVYFESEGQITHPPTVIVRQKVVTKRNISLDHEYVKSSISLSCDRSIASSKVLERDCPGNVVMW
jgi:hypothetical protein